MPTEIWKGVTCNLELRIEHGSSHWKDLDE
jgi:hypothetical protein